MIILSLTVERRNKLHRQAKNYYSSKDQLNSIPSSSLNGWALPLRTRPFVLHYHHHHHDYSFIILIHVGIEEVYGDDDDGRQKIKESGPLKRERDLFLRKTLTRKETTRPLLPLFHAAGWDISTTGRSRKG
jgi:hypothetical protein